MSSLQQQLQTPSKSFSDSKLNLPTPSNLFANTSILSHHVSAPNMNANSTVLPPCSSILLSPNESCVRNSYHKSFTTPNTTNIDENDVTNKSIILPSLDSIIPSPSIKRSLSTNTPALPLPTNLNRHNSNDSFYPKIPQTPTANSLPNINSFVQSTPIPAYNLFPSKHQSSTPINTKITDSENIFKVNPVALKKRKSCCSNETDYNTDTEGSESLNSSKSFAFISHSQATFLSNEPDIDNARLARRKRRRTSPNELSILQNEFALGTTPNKQRRISIAKSVNMTEKEVQIWFQNKRQALRKSQNNNKREYHLQTEKSTTTNITPATSLSPTSSVVSSSSLDSDDMNAEKIVPKIIIDENKENVNPFTGSTPKKENLPPTGVFSSPGKIPLRDITNQHLSSSGAPSQTFKFKPAEFGLPNSGNPVSKRQKPTMKLKIKSVIAPQSNQDLTDCINVLTTPKST